MCTFQQRLLRMLFKCQQLGKVDHIFFIFQAEIFDLFIFLIKFLLIKHVHIYIARQVQYYLLAVRKYCNRIAAG